MSTPLQIGRVSMQMQGALLLSTLQNNQVNLLKAGQQISSGDRLNLGSDDPGATVNIQSLKRQISVNDNYSSNLGFASGFLAQADSSLGDLNTLITQAKSVASSEVGSGVSADERAAQAEVVNALLTRALAIGNQRYQGQAIFGGQNGVDDPFSSVGGGYKYTGTTSEQGIVTPTGGTLNCTINGDEAFGAVSSEVVGYKDLAPMLTAMTPSTAIRGTGGGTVTLGTINVTVGTTTKSIDLGQTATMNDVVNTLNAGLSSMGTTAQVFLLGGRLRVFGDATQTVSFANPTGGTTAQDLGIAGLTVPSGTMQSGQALSTLITPTTMLSALNNGSALDLTGITISNGTNSATISLAGLSTVEDLLNAINTSGTNVRAEINEEGTGINIFNPLSGTELRIGENGGNTAEQLGIRSFHPTTKLADFNNGTGVTPISEKIAGPTGTIVVTRTDGTQFNVTMDGVKTPAQLVAAINGATGNTTVTAALNATGNGISLTDTTGGSGNLAVAAGSNYVSNGSELGLFKTGSGATLTGTNITLSTDDFQITRRDGTSFTVSLGGNPPASTVQDVLDRINNAAGNTNPATKVTAGLNTVGNGISLTDASSGSGTLTVTALNSSEAAAQLGIAKAATSAGVLNGDDNNPLMPQGVFSSLTLLRDSLLKNDTAGITRAATLLEKDGARAIKARGVVGAKEKDISTRKDDVTSEQTQLKSALSMLADADYTEAATKFQQLQTAYQASLQVAQTTRNLSLLDFLK
jgi:flagellin-like hook-associated protein FlgL